jgi:hypothetical protein
LRDLRRWPMPFVNIRIYEGAGKPGEPMKK